MIDFGIMLEGQEDLTWARWFSIAERAEALGFDSIFRSDHLRPLQVEADRATLALWPSLTALALRTKTLRFGPLVAPMTFRHPAMLAKMAASVHDLSGGRLDLGLGAGWFPGEHRMFGIRYPNFRERVQRLEEGLEVITRLLSGQRQSFQGQYFRLENAVNHPAFPTGHPNIIIGGKGDRTLETIVRFADEWNCSYNSLSEFSHNNARVDAECLRQARDPVSLRRSVMIPFAIGRSDSAIQAHIDGHRHTFPNLPADLAAWTENGFIGGRPAQVIDQISAFIEAGVTRFMLQQNELDNLEALDVLAEEVFPHFR
jgi:alkanesulfonate monooxygenase SsuD/methylene tetrahydromethanopterin reductase-like flavin-dependent oxidoreductase (luciferase family)